MLRATGLFSTGVSRISPLKRKSETLVARAKDKKGGKGGAPEKPKVYVDVSDAPPGLTVHRLAYFWNKFCLKPGDKPVTLKYPWEEGKEPQWAKDLTLPYETIVDPVQQLDPEVVGPRKFKKAIRRQQILEFNKSMVAKDYSIIRKNIKQLPP